MNRVFEFPCKKLEACVKWMQHPAAFYLVEEKDYINLSLCKIEDVVSGQIPFRLFKEFRRKLGHDDEEAKEDFDFLTEEDANPAYYNLYAFKTFCKKYPDFPSFDVEKAAQSCNDVDFVSCISMFCELISKEEQDLPQLPEKQEFDADSLEGSAVLPMPPNLSVFENNLVQTINNCFLNFEERLNEIKTRQTVISNATESLGRSVFGFLESFVDINSKSQVRLFSDIETIKQRTEYIQQKIDKMCSEAAEKDFESQSVPKSKIPERKCGNDEIEQKKQVLQSRTDSVDSKTNITLEKLSVEDYQNSECSTNANRDSLLIETNGLPETKEPDTESVKTCATAFSANSAESEKSQNPIYVRSMSCQSTAACDSGNSSDESSIISGSTYRKRSNVTVLPESVRLQCKSPQEVQRQYVICELVESERNFIEDLEFTLGYVHALMRQALGDVMASNLVGNMEELLRDHQSIISILDSAVAKAAGGAIENPGSLFGEIVPRMKSHIEYARVYREVIMPALNLPEVNDFSCYLATLDTTGFQRLDGLLIRPIQRAPKYKLLLNEIKKNMEPGNVDYMMLVNSGLDLGDMLEEIDEGGAQANISMVEQIIEGFAEIPRLASSRFLRQGVFNCIFDGKGVKATHAWFLFSDTLIICKDVKKGAASTRNKHQLLYAIPMSRLLLFEGVASGIGQRYQPGRIPDQNATKNIVEIGGIGVSRDFLKSGVLQYQMHTQDEQQLWLRALRRCIKGHFEHGNAVFQRRTSTRSNGKLLKLPWNILGHDNKQIKIGPSCQRLPSSPINPDAFPDTDEVLVATISDYSPTSVREIGFNKHTLLRAVNWNLGDFCKIEMGGIKAIVPKEQLKPCELPGGVVSLVLEACRSECCRPWIDIPPQAAAIKQEMKFDEDRKRYNRLSAMLHGPESYESLASTVIEYTPKKIAKSAAASSDEAQPQRYPRQTTPPTSCRASVVAKSPESAPSECGEINYHDQDELRGYYESNIYESDDENEYELHDDYEDSEYSPAENEESDCVEEDDELVLRNMRGYFADDFDRDLLRQVCEPKSRQQLSRSLPESALRKSKGESEQKRQRDEKIRRLLLSGSMSRGERSSTIGQQRNRGLSASRNTTLPQNGYYASHIYNPSAAQNNKAENENTGSESFVYARDDSALNDWISVAKPGCREFYYNKSLGLSAWERPTNDTA